MLKAETPPNWLVDHVANHPMKDSIAIRAIETHPIFEEAEAARAELRDAKEAEALAHSIELSARQARLDAEVRISAAYRRIEAIKAKVQITQSLGET